MVWDAVTDAARWAGNEAFERQTPGGYDPVSDHIIDETDAEEREDITVEVIGLTDESGDRLEFHDPTDGFNTVMDGEVSLDGDDVSDEVGDFAGSLWDRIAEMIPLWAWGLGAIVLAGVLYTYTRPLWTLAAGVVPS